MTPNPEDQALSLTYEIVDMTPELAGSLLQGNSHNRSLRAKVKAYAQAMAAGMWQMNGEPLIIGASGRLLDGQHRLNAVILSGATVKMLVVRGVDDETFSTIDTGIARTPGDYLTIRGEKNANQLAGALRWLVRYETGGSALLHRNHLAESHDDLAVALEAHPGIRHAVADSRAMRFGLRHLSPSLLAFSLYVAGEGGRPFFEALETGAGLPVGSPVLLLRNRLAENAISKARLRDSEKLALTIKAFNAWREGRTRRHLRWRTSGDSPEEFPRFGDRT